MSKKFIASVTLAAFSFLAVPVSALSGAEPASMIANSGRVLVEQNGKWVESGLNQVQAGTKVRTGADGTAILSLPGGSLVRLAPNSQVALTEVSDRGVVVELDRGRVIGSTVIGLHVKTDLTVTKASNGEFVVNTSAQGTELNVVSGDAVLVSLDPENAPLESDKSLNDDLANNSDLRGPQAQKTQLVAQGANQDGDDDDDDDEGADVEDSKAGEFPFAAVGIGLGGLIAVILIASQGGDREPPVPSPSLP